jgi:Helix-turn-helix domain
MTMTFDDDEALLLPQEAAKFLHRTNQTLADWREQGGGPHFMRVGRRILYRTSALTAFQESRNQSK